MKVISLNKAVEEEIENLEYKYINDSENFSIEDLKRYESLNNWKLKEEE